MNDLQPLAAVHAGMGAFRSITSDLLAETYLAPRPQPMDLNLVLENRAFPWSASMLVAPFEAGAAVSAVLRSLAVATHCLEPDQVGHGALDRDTSSLPCRDSQRTWHRPSQGVARLLVHPDLRPCLSAVTGFGEATLDVLQAQADALKKWLTAEGYTQIECEVPIQKREASGAEFNGIIDLLATGDGKCLVLNHKSGSGSFAAYFAQLDAYRDIFVEHVQAIKTGIAIHWIDRAELEISI